MQRETDEPAGATVAPSPDASTLRRQSLKRPTEVAGSPNSTEPFSEKAHSVAMNLGLVSLNSDSSQKAYLGSSSGRLFADLVGASPSSDPSSTVATHNTVDEPANDLLVDRQFSLQSRYRSLHYVLRQVRRNLLRLSPPVQGDDALAKPPGSCIMYNRSCQDMKMAYFCYKPISVGYTRIIPFSTHLHSMVP